MERRAEPLPRRGGRRPPRRVARSTWRAARAETRSGSRSSAGGSPASTTRRWRSRRRATAQLPTASSVEFVCADLLDYEPERERVRPRRRPLPPAPGRRAAHGAREGRSPRSPQVEPSSWSATTCSNLTEGVGGPSDPGVLYTPDDSSPTSAGSRCRRPSASSATWTMRTARRSTRSCGPCALPAAARPTADRTAPPQGGAGTPRTVLPSRRRPGCLLAG